MDFAMPFLFWELLEVKMDRDIIEKAKRVNLSQYIEIVLGLAPQRRYKNSVFYFSPFRTETEASLHATYMDGIWVWYDFGSGHHFGDTIQFVRMYRDCSFKEAVEELLHFNGESLALSVFNNKSKHEKPSAGMNKMRRIIKARNTYGRLMNNNVLVRKYFTERGLRFHEEMGCKIYTDFKDHTNYVAIPLPNTEHLRGLELREICPLDRELQTGNKKRKNYGTKTLWVLKRDTSRFLLTESVLDALAGEIILDDRRISLAALNGVGQVSQLEAMIISLKPKEIIVAMDNDRAGQDAMKIIETILRELNIDYQIWNTEAKDLFRELHKTKGGSKNAAYAT
jgi:hypothetical protein